MSKSFKRSDRIGGAIKRELAKLLHLQMKDPRVGMVTVTEVEVTSDLAYAKIFITLLEDEAESIRETLAVLNKASGYLRTELARKVKLRQMPELIFKYDESIRRATHIQKLIDSVIDDDKETESED